MTDRQKRLLKLLESGKQLYHPECQKVARKLTADQIDAVGRRKLANAQRKFQEANQ